MKDRKINIFLADDDEDDRGFFQEAIITLNVNSDLKMVDNGDKAIKYFKTTKMMPDFIFLDINMPFKNGFECLRSIKELYPANAYHTIILSTSIAEKDINLSYELGASAYIQKPGSFLDLIKYLDHCLNKLDFSIKREDFLLNIQNIQKIRT
ncbi:MAG: response regulator [Bacteroidota bacterium]